MIISKCVPLEISRKRFSDFIKNHEPQDMIFVGWKFDKDGKKENVQLNYKHIKDDIIKYIEENGGLGGGGNEGDTNRIPTESTYVKLEDDMYDETEDSYIVDLKKKKSFLEINGGGDYTNECIYLTNAYIGSITNIVVDNTGKNHEEGDSEESWKPVEEFVLYYGLKNSNNYEQILTVPVNCRGIVQILHSNNSDLVINATFTDTSQQFIQDVEPISDGSDDAPYEGQTFEINDKVYVDMNNEAGYIEIDVAADGKKEYTFVFDNTELGSMTYIVLDNINGSQSVVINYGKVMADSTEDIEYIVTVVETGEKAIIEVFHSLSADIVVKITKI